MTASERFWAKVDKDGPIPEHRPDLGPCWVWIAAQDGYGYGSFGDGTRTDAGNWRVVKAHRFAWEEANGPVPDGLELDHLCRNRACVRPTHQEPVTHAENLERGDGNAPRKTCPAGHSYAEHGYYDRSAKARRCRLCRRRTGRAASARHREKAKR